MAALQCACGALGKVLTARAPLLGIRAGQFRGAIYTNRDWKPGPTPKTEAERRAAAKKYNMIYEDYEPYPEDHRNHMGDYPMLPPIGLEHKDPYEDYDFPTYKRNYGEPLNHNFEMFTRERWDVSRPNHYSFRFRFTCFVAVFFGLLLIDDVMKRYNWLCVFTPVGAKKQYPEEGVTHYTFEPAD